MSWFRLGVALAAVTLAASASPQSSGVTIPAALETASPLQAGLRATFAEREAAGLPVPKTEFTYEVVEGPPPAAAGAGQRALAAEPGSSVTIVSRTVIVFETPEQAGYASAWPALEFRNSRLPGAPVGVFDGDYTEAYRAYAEEQAPGIWQHLEFGREPRTYTIQETVTLTFPEGSPAAGALLRALTAEAIDSAETLEQILLGFTYAGPHVDHTIGTKVEIGFCLPWWLGGGCFTIELFEFEAGFRMDWGFGLRLPADVTMSGPLLLASGATGAFHSGVVGVDWAAPAYDGVGVAAYEGNEFVMKAQFFAGVKVEILTKDVCMTFFGFPCYAELDVDESAAFATPFGGGSYFPIDPVRIPFYSLGAEDVLYFEFGLDLQPLIGSRDIGATASVAPGRSASLVGPAALTYAEPGQPVGIAVNACIKPGESRDAYVEVSDFRYWFTEFLVDLGVYGNVQILGKSYDAGRSIYTFDLSGPFGGTLSLGRHMQCISASLTAPLVCSPVGPDGVVALAATVVDVDPPTTTLVVSGTEGKQSWYRSDVLVTLTAIDAPAGCDSGVAQIEYLLVGLPNTYLAPFTFGLEGTTAFSYGSRDHDGMVETGRAFPLKIDKTPPVIAGRTATLPNDHGWFDRDVTVIFDATDALSGVDTVSPNPTLTGEGAGQSATGTAQDLAGNAASTTVRGIHIDKSFPTLELRSPVGPYANTRSFVPAWLAQDAVSGIAHELASVDGMPVGNGEPVPLLLFYPGSHVLRVEAEDMADHAVEAAATFDVTVDLRGVLAAQAEICRMDWINKLGICNSLEAKLLAAIASRERADLPATAKVLGAYLNELDAQWDKAVNPQAHGLLRADVEFLLAHLD